MIEGAVVLFVVALALIIMGISFIVDLNKNLGPDASLATVDDQGQAYTFLRVRGRGVAIFVTVLTFILAAGAVGGAIAMLAMKHH